MRSTEPRSSSLVSLAADLAVCTAGVGAAAWLDALRLGLNALPAPPLAELAALASEGGLLLLAAVLVTLALVRALLLMRRAGAGSRSLRAGGAVLAGWAAGLALMASSGFSLKVGWPAGALLLGTAAGWLWMRMPWPAPGGIRMRIAAAVLLWLPALLLPRLSSGSPEAGPSAAAGGPPSFVLVVIDALRADRIGIYGHDRDTSPNIDRLARAGIRFARAAAPSSWTPPSMASLLTSSTVGQHGLVEKGQGLPPEADLLAVRLRAAGYRTAGFTTNPWLKRVFGFDRGFGTYLDIDRIGLDKRLLGVRLKNWALLRAGRIRVEPELVPEASEVTRRALDWLARHGTSPFFLYLHYMDVHSPYDPVAPYHGAFCEGHDLGVPDHLLEVEFRRGRETRYRDDPAVLEHVLELYDEEILATDAAIGRLVEGIAALGLDRTTHVILTADHGEEFLDHGGVMHGQTLYEEVVHVPLILGPAGSEAIPPRVVDGPVSTLDVYPTVLDLAGLPAREGAAGTSLVPMLTGGGERVVDRVVGSQLFRKGHASTALYLGNEKFIRRRRIEAQPASGGAAGDTSLELFDLDRDPRERINLAGVEAESAGALAGLVESYEKLWGVPGVGGARSLESMDPETLEQLRALGYVD